MTPYTVNANSTLLFNMTHQGTCITNSSVSYTAIPADDGTFNESTVVILAQMNMTTITGYPQYGYQGIRNMARLVQSAMEHAGRPRSALFRRMLYGK